MSDGILKTIKSAVELGSIVFLSPVVYLTLAAIGIGKVLYYSIFDQ